MFRILLTVIWLLLLTICNQVGAQEKAIPLSDVLDSAVSNAPQLQTDSAAINIRQSQLEATQYNWLPSLKLNYQFALGTNNNLPGGYFSYGIIPSNSRVRDVGNGSTILTDLGVVAFDWEIYNFGAYKAQQNLAASDLRLQQSGFEQSKYQLQHFTIENYLQLIRLKDLMAVQLENINRNAEIKKSIHALAVAGIRAGVDTSIAAAELSRARLIHLELKKQYKQLQLQLSNITGIMGHFITPDTLMENRLINSYAKFLDMMPDTAQHPYLLYYKALRENSFFKEKLVHTTYLPKVSLQGAVWGRGASVSAADEFRALSKGLGFERGNYLVGIGITYNIFDQKRKKLQLKTQQAVTQHANQQLHEQETTLQLQVRQAQVELSTAYDRLQEIPQQLEAANAAYRQKLALYRNGLTNLVELNTVLNILYRAENDYINARYVFCRALFQKTMLENQLPFLLQTLN